MKTIRFMKVRVPMVILALALVIISIGAIVFKGLNFGLDFTGGTLVEVEYAQAPSVEDVRRQLESSDFHNVVVQQFGSETSLVIRLQEEGEQVGQRVVDNLRADGSQVELRRSEYVGGQVGSELREKGGLAMLLAMGAILIYVGFRFQFKFAVSSVIALAHDVIVTIGAFALFQWDFDLTVLAAVLAVIGYSLNDTIVVFDRIRENFRRVRKGTVEEIVDISLTQTLIRTIVTSGTTMLVTLVLFLFGGDAVHNFSIALLIGIGIGTFSSIYVATGIALTMGISADDFLLPKKEGVDEVDARP